MIDLLGIKEEARSMLMIGTINNLSHDLVQTEESEYSWLATNENPTSFHMLEKVLSQNKTKCDNMRYFFHILKYISKEQLPLYRKKN